MAQNGMKTGWIHNADAEPKQKLLNSIDIKPLNNGISQLKIFSQLNSYSLKRKNPEIIGRFSLDDEKEKWLPEF